MKKQISNTVLEKIRRAKEKRTQGGNKFLRIENDKPVTIYVLDGTYGEDELFYRLQGIHYLGKKNRVQCPRIIEDQECPICEAFFAIKEEASSLKNDLEDLKKDSDGNAAEISEIKEKLEQLDDEARKFSPSVKYAMNVLVKGEKKPRIMTAPKGVFEDIFNAYASNAEEVNIFDPENAVAFTIEKTGKGMKTSYSTTMSAYTKPIIVDDEGNADLEAIKSAIEGRYNLDEEIKAADEDEAQKALDSFLDGDDDEPEEEEKPRERSKSKSKEKPKSSKKKEPDPEEEEGGGEEEEEGESEKEEPDPEEYEEKEPEEKPKKPAKNAESRVSTKKDTSDLQNRLRKLKEKQSA